MLKSPLTVHTKALNMADFGDEGLLFKVPLNGPADPTAPLKGIVICCTSVPEEKRVRLSVLTRQLTEK